MKEKMKKIGDMFREKRDEMHLSLKEVENATSIRMMYLQAIEEGHIDKFLSPIYALGFIKQYAAFLGFDGDRMIKENKDIFKMGQQKQEFDYGIGTLDHRGGQTNSIKSLPNIMWIGVGGVALIAAWYFARFLGVF
jgi:cytoskeletal protein RodZ